MGFNSGFKGLIGYMRRNVLGSLRGSLLTKNIGVIRCAMRCVIRYVIPAVASAGAYHKYVTSARLLFSYFLVTSYFPSDDDI